MSASSPRAARRSPVPRPLQAMPEDVRSLLDREGLSTAYAARPHYQRNDYLGWIGRAKQAETRERRIRQMLDELRSGDVYMNMAWKQRGERG